MKSFRLFLAGLFVALALPLATSCGGGGGTVTLAAPGGVSIQVGNGFLTISWNTVGGATSYHIYWKVGPGVTKQNSTKITNATRPFTHGGLTNGTNYCYRVVAANAETESNLSEEKCGIPAAAQQPPAPPANLRVVSVGDQTVTVAWDPSPGATSYNLYMASQAGVTKTNYAAKPDGMRHENVTSPFTHPPTLANGRTYFFVVTALNAVGESGESNEVSGTPQAPPPTNLQVSGTVEWDTGGPVVGGACEFKLEVGGVIEAQFQPCGTTNVSGGYNFGANPTGYPVRVLVQITASNSAPVVGTRWSTSQTGPGVVGMGRLILPDLRGAGMSISGGTATRPDGSITIDGVPGNVATIAAQSYDPGANPDAFPGEFRDSAGADLNSTVFLTISAQDASGNPVVDLPQPATVRVQIPQTQWADLQDTQGGNGQIDIPIYSYNYQTGQWVAQPDGWLENAARQIIPEEEEENIRRGAFPAPIFAVLKADHFSWWNVDYAYIYVWTLNRMPSAQRNNKCFYDALRLAERIARSRTGRDALAKVNRAGANIEDEYLTNGVPDPSKNAPEVRVREMEWNTPQEKDGRIFRVTTYGDYWGRKRNQARIGNTTPRQDEFFLNSKIWDLCTEEATALQKKEATLQLAAALLHEWCHQKQHTKKGEPETVEVGERCEKDVFGGELCYRPLRGRLELDRNPVTEAQMDTWLDHDSWPPADGSGIPQWTPAQVGHSGLQISISMASSSFGILEPVPVRVTLTNGGTSPLQVLPFFHSEHHPLRFHITDGLGNHIPWIGAYVDIEFSDEAYVTLNATESVSFVVDLRYDANGGAAHYDLFAEGNYEVKAVYSEFEPPYEPVESESLGFAVTGPPRGSISGRVLDATNQTAIAGATVRAKIGALILGSATTDGQGNYQITNLQPATYTVEAFATGYIRSERTGVVVNSRQDTGQTNFLLSPLLAEGELRVVLGWGQDPRDLDSHLWLPTKTPYHLYYGRRGSLSDCPWANLDQDVVSGFGPETITIRQRVATGTYHYAVHHYSGDSDIPNSDAQVSIYDARGLRATFTPNPGAGRWWHVFSMDGATGSITEINQMLDSYEPYPDTDIGCNPPDLYVTVMGNGTVTSSPPGINCGSGGSDCFEEYPAGTEVVLTATPDLGATLLGWGGHCEPAGTNTTCTLTMDAIKDVWVTFLGTGR